MMIVIWAAVSALLWWLGGLPWWGAGLAAVGCVLGIPLLYGLATSPYWRHDKMSNWSGFLGVMIGVIWLFGAGALLAEGREGGAALALVAPPYGFIQGLMIAGEWGLSRGGMLFSSPSSHASDAAAARATSPRDVKTSGGGFSNTASASGVLASSEPTSIQGNPDTSLLFNVCKEGVADATIDNPKFAACLGIASGILMADALEMRRICVPPELDTKGAINTFLTFASSVTDRRTNGIVTFYQALLSFYPCKR